MAADDPNLSLFGHQETEPRCGQVEAWLRERGHQVLVGLDEAGRGPLAGPVVAAAVVLPSPCPIEGLDDSKRLSEAQREALFDEICSRALAYGIARCEPTEIDQLNILRASMEAMARAWGLVVAARETFREALVLVDGNQPAPLPRGIAQRPLVKGDSRSQNIAAASILAKVTRDRYMVEVDARWPVYGFARHKGYPTPQHRDALRVHGPCPLHRRSFRLSFEPAAEPA